MQALDRPLPPNTEQMSGQHREHTGLLNQQDFVLMGWGNGRRWAALDVPRVDNSSDQTDLALSWLEPQRLPEVMLRGTVKARPHSFWRKPNRCVCWTVGFGAAF